jgi:hypothetical protein
MLTILDALIALLIIGLSLDYLRANQFFSRPAQSVAFFAMAVTAFGLLMARLDGIAPSPGSFLLHVALMAYAGAHSRSISDHWSGYDAGRRSR